MAEMMSSIAFVGTYTTETESEGIHRYRVGPEMDDLRSLGTAPTDGDLFYLTIHPDGEYLYAVNLDEEGTIRAFSIDRETGELSVLNHRSSGGVGACHVSVEASGSYVLVAHYNQLRATGPPLGPAGSVAMLPIGADGRVGEPTDVVEHEGSSVDPDRQRGPHPHAIVPGPENRFAYVPDLGTDEVVVYEMDLDAGTLRPADSVSVQDGAGPRHLDIHPNGRFVYLINELDSTLTAFERDARTGTLEEIETVSTLPDEFDGENGPADVRVHPSGRWVYGTNRGHDSIAVFELDEENGRPHPIGHEPSRGAWTYDLELPPSGTHLLAVNRDTNGIVVFSIDDDEGGLEATGTMVEVPSPVCIEMLSMDG